MDFIYEIRNYDDEFHKMNIVNFQMSGIIFGYKDFCIDDRGNQGNQDGQGNQDNQGEPSVPAEPLPLWDPETETGFGFFESYGLDSATEWQIVEYWWNILASSAPSEDYWTGERHETGYKGCQVVGYYGTYNGYAVVQRWGIALVTAFWHLQSDNISLYTVPPGLYAWKNGQLYRLEDIYKQGLLTREDIIKIGENKIPIKERKYRVDMYIDGQKVPAYF